MCFFGTNVGGFFYKFFVRLLGVSEKKIGKVLKSFYSAYLHIKHSLCFLINLIEFRVSRMNYRTPNCDLINLP